MGTLFSTSANRFRLYAAIALMLFVVCLAMRIFDAHRKHEPLNFVVSDSRGQYVYLPSLVIDHDLDFLNQMQATWGEELERWDVDINARTERGLVPDKYPAGLAMTLTPAFLLGHVGALIGSKIVGGHFFTVDGYSLVYQLPCLAWILVLSGLTMVLIDRLLSEYFQLQGWVIGSAVIAFWLGSNYLWYCIREPFMVHVTSCFWVTCVVYLCVKIRRGAWEGRISPWTIFLLSGAMSMALVCRPSDVFIAPIFLWLLIEILRAKALNKFIAALPAVIPGLLPIGIQCFIWYRMTGHWVNYSYGDERFVWTEPALFQTLFSKLRGLFFWTPLYLLSMAGIIWNLLSSNGKQKSLVAFWLSAALILWYVNSSWWAWSFGRAFGHRAFLELGAFFTVGLALFLDFARQQSRVAFRAAAGATVVFMVYTWGMMVLFQANKIERGDNWTAGGWNPKGTPERALATTRGATQ